MYQKRDARATLNLVSIGILPPKSDHLPLWDDLSMAHIVSLKKRKKNHIISASCRLLIHKVSNDSKSLSHIFAYP